MKCPKCKTSKIVSANDRYHLTFKGWHCPICGLMGFERHELAMPDIPPASSWTSEEARLRHRETARLGGKLRGFRRAQP